MGAYTSFQNILPDPNNAIGIGGQATGTNGVGFASVQFSSQAPVQVSSRSQYYYSNSTTARRYVYYNRYKR